MSAIKKKDTEMTKGKIMKSPILFLKLRAPNPTSKLAQRAIAVINAHVVAGIRFHQDA